LPVYGHGTHRGESFDTGKQITVKRMVDRVVAGKMAMSHILIDA
jgi:hypothetical protein